MLFSALWRAPIQTLLKTVKEALWVTVKRTRRSISLSLFGSREWNKEGTLEAKTTLPETTDWQPYPKLLGSYRSSRTTMAATASHRSLMLGCLSPFPEKAAGPTMRLQSISHWGGMRLSVHFSVLYGVAYSDILFPPNHFPIHNLYVCVDQWLLLEKLARKKLKSVFGAKIPNPYKDVNKEKQNF